MSNGSDGSLSQEDIDILLKSKGEEGVESSVKSEEGIEEEKKIEGVEGSDRKERIKDFSNQQAKKSILNENGLEFNNYENMELLLEVKMTLSVEIGKTRMRIEDILNLGAGSIIELDKLNGELVDIMVNNRLIAKGEVIAIDESFGVKVVNIIDPKDRLKLEG